MRRMGMDLLLNLSVFYYIGIAIWLSINLLTCRRYSISRLRAGLYTLSFLYAIAGAMIGGAFNRFMEYRITGTHTLTLVAIFGGVIFTPIFIVLTVLIEKAIRRGANTVLVKHSREPLPQVSVRDTLDLLTPGCLVMLALSKVACHFDKCCYGIPWSWGTYSPYLDTTVFPVQISESLTTFFILVVVVYLMHKPFYRRGMAYPLAATIYTFCRFGWEFMRYYPPKMRHVFLGLTVWQNCCVAVFAVSVACLLFLFKKYPSFETEYPNKKKKRRGNKMTAVRSR